MAVTRQHLDPLMRNSRSPVHCAPCLISAKFLIVRQGKMPGRKICRCLFWLLYCYESTGASVLLWVFNSSILKHLVSSLGSWGNVLVHLRQPLNRFLSSSLLLCLLLSLLPAGKRSRDLDSLSVIKSRQGRKPGGWGGGGWMVVEGFRRAQRVPPAKAEQRNICVCVSWSMCLSKLGSEQCATSEIYCWGSAAKVNIGLTQPSASMFWPVSELLIAERANLPPTTISAN